MSYDCESCIRLCTNLLHGFPRVFGSLYVTPLTAVASAAILYVNVAPGRRRKDVTGLPVAILDESMFKVMKVNDMSILSRLAKRSYGIITRDPLQQSVLGNL